PLRDGAAKVLDTSAMTPGELRDTLSSICSSPEARAELLTTIVSFGYKFGIPLDSDLVLDVRFLPNPHYVQDLRAYTGNDRRVADFLESCETTRRFFEHVESFLRFLLPEFRKEGKSYLTIAVGCTGGRHRSVYAVNRVAEILQSQGTNVRVQHRDVGR
ncbi:MAG: RNase adapter RapZ, partial [Candidatus Eisenbacteria bacterium]